MAASYGSVPFDRQIEFMRHKLAIPTQSWTDIYNGEHDWAFMVAGASRSAIVEDFQMAVNRYIGEGRTLEQFRKDFDRIVATYGWDYNGGREWRSRVIYETNLFSSYNAGRYEQLYATRHELPYWQYHHSDAVEHPREEHLAWDGMILRADDPWWQWFFPINAWGCQCSVTALSEADLRRLGKSGPDTAPPIEWEDKLIGQRSPDGPRLVRVPKGIDPGFEHIPGASRLHGATPPASPNPPPTRGALVAPPTSLPPPRAANAASAATAQTNDFLARFGATRDTPVIFRDVVGERLAIGAEMFMTRANANSIGDDNRWLLLADTIIEPDEIWVYMDQQTRAPTLRRRYLARWLFPGRDEQVVAVIDFAKSGWSAAVLDDAAADTLRFGVRLYRREE